MRVLPRRAPPPWPQAVKTSLPTPSTSPHPVQQHRPTRPRLVPIQKAHMHPCVSQPGRCVPPTRGRPVHSDHSQRRLRAFPLRARHPCSQQRQLTKAPQSQSACALASCRSPICYRLWRRAAHAAILHKLHLADCLTASSHRAQAWRVASRCQTATARRGCSTKRQLCA